MDKTDRNTILILTEDEGSREALGLILIDQYDTIKTNDPDQALDILKNDQKIFLLMLGIAFITNDDSAILPQIKKDYPRIKTILVSGYKSDDNLKKIQDSNTNGLITKPFVPEEVLRIIKNNH